MIRITGSRTGWPLAAGAVVLAAAAACQSAPDPAPATPATAPATAPAAVSSAGPTSRPAAEPAGRGSTALTPAALPRCHTADLAVEVGQSDSATGHTGLDVMLVNRSTHRCRIYGYGGIQLLDAAGAALPTHQDRGQRTPSLVTLRPGDRAHSPLFWISSTDAVPCVTASALLVTPPDETESLRAQFAHTVCGNGVIDQGAYQPDPT